MEQSSPKLTKRLSLKNVYSKEEISAVFRSKSSKTLNGFLKRKEEIKSNLKKLISAMDSYTNARTTLFFVIIFYMLGRGLNSFTYTCLSIYIYLLIYRLIRFWVKNNLMYMLDFVYFGNIFHIIFLIFYKDNKSIFLAIYSISTGFIGLTNIVQKNKIELSNSDFVMNTFLNSIPVLSTSAIRWKHKLYYKSFNNYINIGYIPLKNDTILWKLIFIPIGLWSFWALGFLVLNGKILKNYAYSGLFESSIYNFYHNNILTSIFGEHKTFTVIKYLFCQFILLILSIPIVINCFYNPYFNLFYIIFMNLILGVNTSRAKNAELKCLVKGVK